MRQLSQQGMELPDTRSARLFATGGGHLRGLLLQHARAGGGKGMSGLQPCIKYPLLKEIYLIKYVHARMPGPPMR